jgi:hypothetical protein
MNGTFRSEKLKGRNHLGYIGVCGKIILKGILTEKFTIL